MGNKSGKIQCSMSSPHIQYSSIVLTMNETGNSSFSERSLYFFVHGHLYKLINQRDISMQMSVYLFICLLMGALTTTHQTHPRTNLIHTGHAQFTVTHSPSIHTHPSYKQRSEHEKTPSCDMPKHGRGKTTLGVVLWRLRVSV